MPDRPRDHYDDDARYRWVWGEGQRPGGGDSSDDPDATRAIPRTQPPPGPADDPDATRAMPATAPPEPPPPAAPPPAPPRSRTPPPAEPDRRRTQQPAQEQPGWQPERAPLPPPNLPPPGASGSRPATTPARKPRSRAKVVRRVLLVLVLVWILFLVLLPVWAWSKIEKVDATPDGDRPADQPGTTYLVVGSDSREGLSDEEKQDLSTGSADGERTDTIMLLHTGSGPTTLVSLPRDSPVEVPGQGTTKINSAFAAGGPPLLVETVEQATGVRVDGYIEIGLGGFVSIVDALGGVEICPEQAIADPKAGLDIPAGCQNADGPTALGFARTRAFATADLQRVQNQREVVSSIADEAASPWTVLNPWRYYSLASAGADSIRIGDDVGPIDLARFAWAMGEVSGGGKTCTVPLASGDATWDPDRAEQLFRLVAEDRTDEISAELCTANGFA